MAPAQKLYNVVSVLGPPGSGKGTQCVKIMKILASCTYQQEIFYALNVNDKALNWSADRAPYYEWDNCACRNHLQTVGKRQGRTDDNEESLRKRIETYNSQTLSIIQHYEKLGLVKEVPSDKSPEEVYLEVENVFKKGGL